ncbi:MAG TPA: LysR family transcriptional regulator [Streptosporangiaceae bacterium]|jgi:DNA-binding transcriptional LysR family regulator
MFELRHLRLICEIAQSGSYSAAARGLGYTQPAISQQMRALEREAGTPLVTRAGRRMRLTEAGEALARRAAGILSSVAAAEDELAGIAGLRAGRVRLTAFPSGSATLVPAAIARLAHAHPGIRVSLTEAEPPEAMRALRDGEADIALTFSYGGDDGGASAGLAEIPLLDDPLMAVLPDAHPLSGRTSVKVCDLAGEAWIAGCERCRGNLLRLCAGFGFEPDIAFATDDSVAVQSLVAAGLGVALVPGLVLSASHNPGTVAVPVDPEPRRGVSAVVWPDSRTVPAVAAMLDTLTAVAAVPA